MGLGCFVITFIAVEDGVLAFATAVIGRPASKTEIITGEFVGSSRHCDRFEVKGVGFLLTDALCASEEQFAFARPGDQLVLYGRQSPFGFNVSSTEVRAAPQDASGR